MPTRSWCWTHGRIVERGTHRELLARGGAYAEMWALQQQEEEAVRGGTEIKGELEVAVQINFFSRSIRMRHPWFGVLLAGFALSAVAADDIVLRGMGSFHVGGRIVEVNGKPVRMIVRQPGGPPGKLDPNGQYMVEQMYVQYFLPKHRKGKLPLLMWHGGGLTGVTYESDAGRARRLAQHFHPQGLGRLQLRRGRARALRLRFARYLAGRADFLTLQDPFERFRIGEGEGSWNADPARRRVLPGSQFPVEAYDNYMKQSVPRWLSTDQPIIAGYLALVDKICPCVMVVHSQGGAFGFKVAEQRPDKVKAIVAIESATAGNVPQAAALKNTPVLMIFGDYVDQHRAGRRSKKSTWSMATPSRPPVARSTGSTCRTSASRATRIC